MPPLRPRPQRPQRLHTIDRDAPLVSARFGHRASRAEARVSPARRRRAGGVGMRHGRTRAGRLKCPSAYAFGPPRILPAPCPISEAASASSAGRASSRAAKSIRRTISAARATCSAERAVGGGPNGPMAWGWAWRKARSTAVPPRRASRRALRRTPSRPPSSQTRSSRGGAQPRSRTSPDGGSQCGSPSPSRRRSGGCR